MEKLFEFAQMYADGLIECAEFRMKVVLYICSDDFDETQMNKLFSLLQTGAALKAGTTRLITPVGYRPFANPSMKPEDK